ncbi:putative protein disulfide-isomerase [Lachnellula hyalina]|uniref:protein disulfide-isomerase n=1 Tax=Lachnellula hyalina TaxID=1316788 RepID=A0A8H8QWK5_9HELO|nr:putative protein disulfide-isomerase [Lachnellula hyalina]TVY24018.1 putative protein disulfide-isomerase [Lachnellula hyalina]
MVHTTSISLAAVALLAALPVNAGLYTKNSPVIQIDGKNYDRLIAKSNYTSIVEFYAPWCGHCKNLQPAYEKAAKSLAGLAKVAAVDCDEESNKQFCGGFGVQGFPTLKIVKPGNKPGKPIVEDYQGPRTAKGIVDAVIDKIPNNVKKVDDKGLEAWLDGAKETPKAILFTDKGKTSALMKAIAIEFKGSVSVAQIRDKEKASVELFGITKFPTLLLLPGGKEAAEGIVYDGELKKDDIVKFLSQAATPNPDPSPAKVKLPKSKSSKKASKEEAFKSASASQASEEGTAAAASATEEVLEEEATESPDPKVDTQKPIIIQDPAPPISLLITEEELRKECLGPRTGTCILTLLSDTPDELASSAVGALSELAHKYKQHKRKLFPFYVVAPTNSAYGAIKDYLNLKADTELVAVNGRRGWWKQLPKAEGTLSEKDVTEEALENWIEAIRLGEGAKQKLPDGLIPEEVEEAEPTPETPEPAGETVTIEEPAEQKTITVEEVKEETVSEEKPKATVHEEL